MSKKKVLIIGAGISGLSVGCYLQMNGYDTEIFELHNIPGGLCTAWKRQGYTFDGCIHWLCGSTPEDDLYVIWKELGAIQDKQFVYHDIFVQTKFLSGDTFSMYTDVEELEKEMLRHAPEDGKLIKDFTKAIRVCSKANMPVLKSSDLYTLLDGLKIIFQEHKLIWIVHKWGNISMGEFQERFKNPLFKEHLTRLSGMYKEMPMFALIYTMALFNKKAAGYPVGGSLGFINSIEKRYLELGGKINYSCKVEKILVEENKAVGIKLSDDREFAGDLVISAADGHYTIYNLLEGKFIDDVIEGYYKNLKLFPALIQVSLGVSREFTDLPSALTFNFSLDDPICIDPKHSISELGLKIFNFDPTFAPIGKTTITTMFEADFEYWVNLRSTNPDQYLEEKNRLAASIIKAIDNELGKIKDHVEVFDVATPYTYFKYTNNWKGSFEGFLPTVGNMGKRLKITLPGLDNFYMIGQWVQPGGGLPTGGMHGRHLTQLLCKKDRKIFKTLHQS